MKPGDRVRRIGQGGDHQMGRLVETEDGIAVQLDRGTHAAAERVIVPYRPDRWEVMEEPRLQPMQIARCCYVADRALRIGRGEYSIAEWDSMREDVRVSFAKNGPPKDDEQRVRLFNAITAALKMA